MTASGPRSAGRALVGFSRSVDPAAPGEVDDEVERRQRRGR